MTTPQEIREKSFDKARSMFGGYDMGVIDDYLEELADDFEALQKENSVLKGKMKLHLVNPSEFGEAAEIADSLKSRQAVLMNLEMADDVTARRMIDFLSGVAYALGGKIMRVSGQAYIVTPTNVDLVGDAVSDFESAGLYF